MPSTGIFLDDDKKKEIAGTASAWTKNTTDLLNISLELDVNLDTFLTGHRYDVKSDLEELKLKELQNNFMNGSTKELHEIEELNEKDIFDKPANKEEIKKQKKKIILSTFKEKIIQQTGKTKNILNEISNETDKEIFKNIINFIKTYEENIQGRAEAKNKNDLLRFDKKNTIITKIDSKLKEIKSKTRENKNIEVIITKLEDQIKELKDIEESYDIKSGYITKPESLLRDKFAYLLRNIYNDVETEISRPFEMSTKIVASTGDIECKNDGNFYLSVEVKTSENKNTDNAPYQLVTALISQAFFKLRRGQDFNGKIEVFGVVLVGLLVNFYKADFTKDNLECIRNKKTPTTKSIVMYTSSFSLKDENSFKTIIETLYRLKNSTRKDCISNYLIENKIRFDFRDTDKPLDKYLKIIKAVVKNEDLGMLAGDYFLRKYINDVSKENELRIYIRSERTHVKNVQFDTEYYMKLLTEKLEKSSELKLEASADPSYFLKVVEPIYLVLNSYGNYVIKFKSDETENKEIKTHVRFTELSIKVSIIY